MNPKIAIFTGSMLMLLAFFVGRISGERQGVLTPITWQSPEPSQLQALSQPEALSGEAVEQKQKPTSSVNETPDALPNTFLVTRVIDGDTIELENGERVRYIGIDTPESVDPRTPIQCFGKEAAKKNEELALNQGVKLEKDITDRDKYGRLLRYVYVNDTFVNLELVKTGYAHAYTYPPDVKYNAQFLAAEKGARMNKQGLWSACQDAKEHISTKTVNKKSPTPDCHIKGNINTKGEKIYHLPGCSFYAKTKIDIGRGEQYFCSEEEARAKGWRKALNCP